MEALTGDERKRLRISAGTVGLSVGLMDVGDLTADPAQALNIRSAKEFGAPSAAEARA